MGWVGVPVNDDRRTGGQPVGSEEGAAGGWAGRDMGAGTQSPGAQQEPLPRSIMHARMHACLPLRLVPPPGPAPALRQHTTQPTPAPDRGTAQPPGPGQGHITVAFHTHSPLTPTAHRTDPSPSPQHGRLCQAPGHTGQVCPPPQPLPPPSPSPPPPALQATNALCLPPKDNSSPDATRVQQSEFNSSPAPHRSMAALPGARP